MCRKRQHALENPATVGGRQRNTASRCRHVERRTTDARKVSIRAGQRRHLGIEKDGPEPILLDAAVAERLLELGLKRPDVEERLVDVADDDTRHAIVPLTGSEAASDSQYGRGD